MYKIEFEFTAQVESKKHFEALEATINKNLESLNEFLNLQWKVSLHEKQESELDYIADLKSVNLHLRLNTEAQQLANYHHVAQIISGYLGILSTLDVVMNPSIQLL